MSRAHGLAKWAPPVLRVPMTVLVFSVFVTSCQPAPNPQTTPPQKVVTQQSQPPKHSTYPADFQAWLTANPDQAVQFDALKAYLAREGVAEVLPLWQLIQTETQEAATKCEIARYATPPQDMWPTMVPTLRLIRQEIVPLLGPVKVLSSFRTNAANRCSLGAPQSPHKRYSALDLAVVNEMPQKEMFAKLCKHWYGLSPSWGYGLGAYYVRGYPAYNQEGRFHVDTLGRRTWGHSYGAYTSHCRELGYIKVKSPDQIKAEEEAKLKAQADALAKTEADAKAKIASDVKAKVDGEILAKAKAKEDTRLKAVAIAKAAKVQADADASSVKIMVPPSELTTTKGASKDSRDQTNAP
jgi:Peptidase M15